MRSELVNSTTRSLPPAAETDKTETNQPPRQSLDNFSFAAEFITAVFVIPDIISCFSDQNNNPDVRSEWWVNMTLTRALLDVSYVLGISRLERVRGWVILTLAHLRVTGIGRHIKNNAIMQKLDDEDMKMMAKTADATEEEAYLDHSSRHVDKEKETPRWSHSRHNSFSSTSISLVNPATLSREAKEKQNAAAQKSIELQEKIEEEVRSASF